jgi:hypothetical protein
VLLERDVEQYLRGQVEKLGGRCDKFNPDLNNGMPDRIVMLPGGVLIWVELKKDESADARRLQKMQHRKLRKLGQQVCVIHTKAQVDELISEYKLNPTG